MPESGDARISLSEAKLDAALVKMELRLRIYFDEQLKGKADTAAVVILQSEMAAMQRGDFSPAFRRSLVEVVEQQGVSAADRTWTRRERAFGAVGAFVAVIALMASLYFGIQAAASATGDVPPTSIEGVLHETG